MRPISRLTYPSWPINRSASVVWVAWSDLVTPVDLVVSVAGPASVTPVDLMASVVQIAPRWPR